MPSKKKSNWRRICEYEHLGALCGKARGRGGGAGCVCVCVCFFLNGAKVTKPSTVEIKF